jgi:hypothetical protein
MSKKKHNKLRFILSRIHKDVWRSGGIVPSILNLGIAWRRVVNFTPRPLGLQERAPDTYYETDWAPRLVYAETGKRYTVVGSRDVFVHLTEMSLY